MCLPWLPALDSLSLDKPNVSRLVSILGKLCCRDKMNEMIHEEGQSDIQISSPVYPFLLFPRQRFFSTLLSINNFLSIKLKKAATTVEMGLQVGIVGAGVAGLSAAIALRRVGHEVEVY